MNKEIFEYLFKGLMTLAVALMLNIFSGFESSIAQMQASVAKLNTNFAVFSEKLMTQRENHLNIDERVTKIEEGLILTMSTRFTKRDGEKLLDQIERELDEIREKIKEIK